MGCGSCDFEKLVCHHGINRTDDNIYMIHVASRRKIIVFVRDFSIQKDIGTNIISDTFNPKVL